MFKKIKEYFNLKSHIVVAEKSHKHKRRGNDENQPRNKLLRKAAAYILWIRTMRRVI